MRAFRQSRLESLEPRRVLAAPTLGALPSEVTLLSGAPLHIGLDGFDGDTDSLTYTTSVDNASSENLGLTAVIPKQIVTGGNRSIRITVEHHLGTSTPNDTSDDQVVSFGTMEFELFEKRASRATSQIIALAESGWYDGKLFHRVISDFMIQGGSKEGDGTSGSGTTFDDQFHPTLQHTSAGLLSMAKSGDDTNDSQFFVTAGATRWLDFNHTVFGLLTSGDDVRELIAAVPEDGDPNWQKVEGQWVNLGGNNRPLNDVVIKSVEVFYDHEDAVMLLQAPEGASGEADVTVTVSDGDKTAQRTVHVKVEPDVVYDKEVHPDGDPYANGRPYLQDIDPIWVDFDTARTFNLAAVDVEGDQIFFSGRADPSTSDLDVSVTQAGVVTITPKNDEFGAYTVMFEVGPASNSDTDDQDSQLVPVFVRPPAPTVELDVLSDTGAEDGVTAINNGAHKLRFLVSGVAVDATAWLEADGTAVAASEVSRTAAGDGTYDVLLELTGGQLADNVYEYRAGQTVALTGTNAGTDLTSDLSGLLSVTIDTTVPVIGSDPVLTASVDEPYRYQVQATDGDNTDILYEVQTPYPGMQQDPQTGVITWTPDVNQAGIRPLVVFAIDGAGNTARQEFEIVVNGSLVISLDGDTEAAEESTLSFLVSARDSDDLDAAVDINLQATTLPSGATYSLTKVDDNQARFEWSIAEEDAPGEYEVTFRATDSLGAAKEETFTLTATEVNTAPELTVAHAGWTPGELLNIDEDEALLLDIAATDADRPANDLVFSLAGDVPAGASIDPDTGQFTWTPSEQQGDLDFNMIVRVTDSGGLSDELTVNIAVEEVNSPPVFDPVESQTTYEGLDLEVDVTARDPDDSDNYILYSLVEGEYPEGAVIDPYAGKITWEVPDGFLDDHDPEVPIQITVKAEEIVPAGEESLSSLATVEVTVAGNLEELLAGVALTSGRQNSPILSAPAAPFGTSTLDGPASDTSTGTPSGEALDLGDDRTDILNSLFGDGSSSTYAGGEAEPEDETKREDEPDQTDPDAKAGDNEGANLALPRDVPSTYLADAAIEEYLDTESRTDETPPPATDYSERQGDGQESTTQDDTSPVIEEELVAAVDEKQAVGSRL